MMFFLSKAFTFLFLPPGLFIIALLVSVLLFLSRRRKAGAIVAFVSLGALTALSLGVVADALIRPLEDSYPPLAALGDQDSLRDAALRSGGEMVVVLGGGVVARSPEEGLRGSLGPESGKRLVYGLRVARAAGLGLVFSGGRVFDGPGTDSEADAARRFIEESGEKVEARFEGESRSTLENARNVAAAFHPRSAIIVTSAYHMPRAVLAFERAGIKALPAPTDYKASRAPLTAADILPAMEALRRSWTALHEWVGLAASRAGT